MVKCFRSLMPDQDRLQCTVTGYGVEGGGINGLDGNQSLQLSNQHSLLLTQTLGVFNSGVKPQAD